MAFSHEKCTDKIRKMLVMHGCPGGVQELSAEQRSEFLSHLKQFYETKKDNLDERIYIEAAVQGIVECVDMENLDDVVPMLWESEIIRTECLKNIFYKLSVEEHALPDATALKNALCEITNSSDTGCKSLAMLILAILSDERVLKMYESGSDSLRSTVSKRANRYLSQNRKFSGLMAGLAVL